MNWQKIVSQTKELIAKNQFILYLLVFCLAFFVYLWLQSSPTFLDPDSFYHLKMAKLIAENHGPIINFPWLQYTVLKNYYVDHHLLYHVMAIPFIKIFGDFIGFKLYTAILSTFFILLSYAIFKKYRIKFAEIFILIMVFAPAFLFRISLAKASAFSLIFLFSGIYGIFKKKYWLLFIISFFYVWAYGGFLLILVMAGIYVFADACRKAFLSGLVGCKNKLFGFFRQLVNTEDLKIIIAILLGNALGLIINPYFPQNLSFYWQQIIQIGLINYRGPVNVGGEWYPYPPLELLGDMGAVLIFAVIGFTIFFVFYKKQKTESIFFLITSLFFLALTLKSKRYVEYFVPFLVYFSAFATTFGLQGINIREFFASIKDKGRGFSKLFTAAIIYLVIIIPLIMIKDAYITRQSFEGGISFQRFAGISRYLEEKTRQGDIIMHTSWDDFPMLFYYNSKDYYIIGLDPTFMYKYNPDLYNLYADITMAKKSDHLYPEIKENFKASFFIVNSGREMLEKNLQSDGNFIKVYEDADGEIYKLK